MGEVLPASKSSKAAPWALVILLASSFTCQAQTSGIDPSTSEKISSQLRSGDEQQVGLATQEIEELLAKQPRLAAQTLTDRWAKWYWAGKYYKTLNKVAKHAILAAPELTQNVEPLQRIRMECLYYMGGRGCAAYAKALYNVASVETVDSHLDSIAKCLKYWKRKDPDIGARFLAEQKDPKAAVGTVLSTVHISKDRETRKALEALTVNDFDTLIGRGNLLLLWDMPDDAKSAFEKARSVATQPQQAIADDSIARAMKAKNGTCVRARQWLAQHEEFHAYFGPSDNN